jgi:membrane dipeptidase
VLRAEEANPFAAHWLPNLRAGGVGLQVCAVYTLDAPEPAAAARELVDAFERAIAENEDDVFAVRTRHDLAAVDGGRIGLMLSFEGVEPLDGDPEAFAQWWDAGVRMVSLTWNASNAFAGGIDSPDKGLTDAGRELVDELVGRGGLIDLAHASERTFFDVLEYAPDAHVLVSHACCRAVHDHPRNLSDDQLRALAEHGGVLGAMALRLVVGGDATLDRFVDHVDHAVEVMGEGHVALGADVIDQVLQAELAAGKPQQASTLAALEEGGGALGLVDFEGPEDFPALVAALRARGYEGERLDGITHGSLLRLLGDAFDS